MEAKQAESYWLGDQPPAHVHTHMVWSTQGHSNLVEVSKDHHHQFLTPRCARAHFPMELSPSSWVWVGTVTALTDKMQPKSWEFWDQSIRELTASTSFFWETLHLRMQTPCEKSNLAVWRGHKKRTEATAESPHQHPGMGMSLPGHSSPVQPLDDCRPNQLHMKRKNRPEEPSQRPKSWGIITDCC